MIQRQMTVNAERFLVSKFGKIAPAVDFLKDCELASMEQILLRGKHGSEGFRPSVRYVVSSEMPYGCEDFRGSFNSGSKVFVNVEKTHEFAQTNGFSLETAYSIVQAHELQHAYDQAMTKLGDIWNTLIRGYVETMNMTAAAKVRAVTDLMHEVAIVEGVFDGRAVLLTAKLVESMNNSCVDLRKLAPRNNGEYALYARFMESVETAFGDGMWGLTARIMPATYSEFSDPEMYISRVMALESASGRPTAEFK